MGSAAEVRGEKLFEAKATRLNYLDWGAASAPPLIMLHGGAWRWQEYLSLIPSLAQRWHVLALDLRGNGRSGWVPGSYRLRDFAEDNAQFLRGLSAPAVLVGHSIGAVIALMLAAQRPGRVRGLILEDPALTLETYRRVVNSSREMFGLWLKLKERARSEEDLALALADAYRDYPATSGWILFFAGCLWQLDPTFFNALLNDFEGFTAGYDCRETLATIDCPVLLLRGEAGLGAVTTDEETAWLREDFGNIRVAVIEGIGHLLHLEDRGQRPVLAEMTAFLEGVRGG